MMPITNIPAMTTGVASDVAALVIISPSPALAPTYSAATTAIQPIAAAARAALASVGAAAALWSGVNGWRAYSVNSQDDEIAMQIRSQELQYQQITRESPPSPTSGDNLKRAVETAKALRDSARDPVPMMVLE